jgi:hypothetical protein
MLTFTFYANLAGGFAHASLHTHTLDEPSIWYKHLKVKEGREMRERVKKRKKKKYKNKRKR